MRYTVWAALSVIVASGCSVAPVINSITPSSGTGCTTITMEGVFENITAGYMVDAAGAQTPLVMGSLQPHPNTKTFQVDGKVPAAMAPGAYRVKFDQGGGNVFFIGTINSGPVTSKATFQVTASVPTPQASLGSASSPNPGAAVSLPATVAGTTTSVTVTPGSAAIANGTVTERPCQTTKYTLAADNQCASASAQGTITVALPVVTAVKPTTIAAGNSITITGTGFDDPTVCAASKVILTHGTTKFTLTAKPSPASPTSLTEKVDACLLPGTYVVNVQTEAGVSNGQVQLVVTAASSPCPASTNPCTTNQCSGLTCVSMPLNGKACQGGTCSNGTCVQNACATMNPKCGTCAGPNGSCWEIVLHTSDGTGTTSCDPFVIYAGSQIDAIACAEKMDNCGGTSKTCTPSATQWKASDCFSTICSSAIGGFAPQCFNTVCQ